MSGSETEPSELKPKKMVSRSVAIALGIVCILLIAGLGVAMVYYSSYVNDHHNADYQYDSLQNQVNDLFSIVHLYNSTVWVNNQTMNQNWMWDESANYAGYVSITVLSSTNRTTWLNVLYYAHNYTAYDNPTTIGTNGTAYFTVLPSPIYCYVGDPNTPFNGTTVTVTITYYY